MEVLDNVLKKMGVKKPKPVVIKITDLKTKSCGNCDHRLGPTWGSVKDRCAHYPNADLTDVINKICIVSERPYWSPKKYGVIRRFLMWLF